jgi:hypothetical protein
VPWLSSSSRTEKLVFVDSHSSFLRQDISFVFPTASSQLQLRLQVSSVSPVQLWISRDVHFLMDPLGMSFVLPCAHGYKFRDLIPVALELR